MRIALLLLVIGAATPVAVPLAAQSTRAKPPVVQLPGTAHVGTSERILTITGYAMQVATDVMDLERVYCHLNSSTNNIWVVECEAEDLPSGKPRTLVMGTCDLTVRYLHDEKKWDVGISAKAGTRCVDRWADDDHLSLSKR